MYDLSTFGFNDLMALRAQLQRLADEDHATFEAGARRVVDLLRTALVDGDGRPACPLVRLFRTHPLARLDDDLRAHVDALSPGATSVPGFRCLVLVATAGDEPDWNDRRRSKDHGVIPLESVQAVEAAPMVAQLFQQMGLQVSTVLRPDPAFVLDAGGSDYNVFYVPEAVGSPYIVAQDAFVRPYGIRSVLGFGGLMATGDLVALVLFSRVPISPRVADLFKVVGLNVKLAMLRAARKPLFDPRPPPVYDPDERS